MQVESVDQGEDLDETREGDEGTMQWFTFQKRRRDRHGRRNRDMLCTMRVGNRRSRRRSDELEGICCQAETYIQDGKATSIEHRWVVVQYNTTG